MAIPVKLQIFEGPLDLLLHLIEKNKVDLEKTFGFTNAIITPDGNWHGMIPLNLLSIGFTKKEPCEEYIKNYYTKYIKPFEETGSITILTCNI